MVLDPLNTFWAGILVCYVLQPLRGAAYFISWYSEAVFVQTLAATLFGITCVIIAYEAPLGRSLARRMPSPPARIKPAGLLFGAVACLLAGLAGYAYVIGLSGGLERWLSVGRGGTDYDKVQGYLPELTGLLPAGVLLFLFRANLHSVRPTERLVAWLLAGLQWWWFLYLGARGRIIGFTLLVMCAYYLPRRRNPGPIHACLNNQARCRNRHPLPDISRRSLTASNRGW